MKNIRAKFTALLMMLALGVSYPLGAADAAKEKSAAAKAPRELTLTQALKLALERNTSVILSEINQKIFESQYWQALGTVLPEIDLTGSYTRNIKRPLALIGGSTMEVGRDQELDFTASARQPLYTGGKVRTAIRAAGEQRELGHEETQSAQETVMLGVKRFFYGTLLGQQLEQIQSDNLKSTEDHLKTVNERYRQGLDSDLIVRRQEVEVANAKAALLLAQNFKDNMMTDLQDILALDIDAPMTLAGELAPPKDVAKPYEYYVEKAMEARPDIKAAHLKTMIAKDLIRIAEGDLKPRLALFGQYQWTAQYDHYPPDQGERATTFYGGGLELRQQLFAGGRDWQGVKKARLEYEQAREDEKRVERSVRVEVKKQWMSAVEALARSQAEEKAIDEARLALEATETRYRQGQSGFLELQDTRLALNRVRTIYSQASYDYWMSLAGVEKAAGIPPEEVSK